MTNMVLVMYVIIYICLAALQSPCIISPCMLQHLYTAIIIRICAYTHTQHIIIQNETDEQYCSFLSNGCRTFRAVALCQLLQGGQRATARNVLHPLVRKLQYCSSVRCCIYRRSYEPLRNHIIIHYSTAVIHSCCASLHIPTHRRTMTTTTKIPQEERNSINTSMCKVSTVNCYTHNYLERF